MARLKSPVIGRVRCFRQCKEKGNVIDGFKFARLMGVVAITSFQLSYAETSALLVGVSGYPSLPESRRLRGPANDVQIMRDALVRSGVPANRVRVLADGVAGSSALPTRQAILDAMRTLADQSKPDDWVIVYISGHGSQQPQPPGTHAYTEPDGMDDIFLPYDIGRWDGSKMAVQGAILDDEIGLALASISRNGARVWAIFDTCHAGGMAKGLPAKCAEEGCPVNRYVSPRTLGVPDQALSQMKPLRSKQSNRLQTANNTVYFFASQKDEPAAEEPLPDLLSSAQEKQSGPLATGKAVPKRYFGLFTYLIAKALPSWQGNFSALANHVAERYKTRPYPTPLFEGNLGHTPGFSTKTRLTEKNITPIP
jgi:hypothetical protein